MKYPKQYYVWLLSQVVSWLEDKQELVEDLIAFSPQADREALRNLFNQY